MHTLPRRPRPRVHHGTYVGKPGNFDWTTWRNLAFLASLVLNVLLIFVVFGGFVPQKDVFLPISGTADFSLEVGVSTHLTEQVAVSAHGAEEVAVSSLDTEEAFRKLSSSSASTASTASSTSASTSASSGGSGEHHAHQTDALLYLFNTLIAGAAVMQFTTRFPYFPLTVILFAMGFIVSIFLKHTELIDKLRIWGDSWQMWMEIDPHLLLFTLLPALLAGDAMTIDPSVARRVGLQCLWLAGPGVLVCGFATAGFLKLFLGWDFWLCVCSGAILCATDPVAVVALLKELGASPVLTVQIQGESLLNDGTSIVLYLISYNILKGENYEWSDVAEFLIKKAIMAFALGLFIGYAFYYWISYAGINKLDHTSSMIQITLTLCCAYWSFIFVEGVLMLSGVLATVASSLVLARYMWPHICSPNSMHHVWHTFESLGNTIIFFLAGSITGWIIGDIEPICYFHLIVIYTFLLCLRTALIFASRPILRRLSADGAPLKWQDGLVMSWGGLRGAVGLAMAVTVNLERAPNKCDGVPSIDTKKAECLLFYVSGVALLTMLINATTAPRLVNKLGITAQPADRQKLLKMFHQQLVEWSQVPTFPGEVNEAMKSMMMAAEEEIDHQKWKRKASGILPFNEGYGFQTNEEAIAMWQDKKAQYEKMVASYDGRKQAIDVGTGDVQHLILGLPVSGERPHLLGKVDDMIQLIKDQPVDEGMAKVVNEVFLKLVNSQYSRLVASDFLPPGSPEHEVLVTSLVLASSPLRADLVDYRHVHQHMVEDAEFNEQAVEDWQSFGDEVIAATPRDSTLAKIIASWQFNSLIFALILLNALQVLAEEVFRHNCKEECGSTCEAKAIDDHWAWLFLDAFFTIAFLIECMLKVGLLRADYFKDTWNLFDFFLVVIGIFGLIVSIVSDGSGEAELAGQTRVIRLARVLRALRFLRMFRLLNAWASADKHVSKTLAQQLKQLICLSSFCEAHLLAQQDLIKFFGGNGKVDEVNETELARCIIQSQSSVYQALTDAGKAEVRLGKNTCDNLANLLLRKAVTEHLSTFILQANEEGALSATETHAILHPLHNEVALCITRLYDMAEGIVDRRPMSSKKVGGHH